MEARLFFLFEERARRVASLISSTGNKETTEHVVDQKRQSEGHGTERRTIGRNETGSNNYRLEGPFNVGFSLSDFMGSSITSR